MTKLPIIESYWVEENRFLAGEYPGGYDHETTRRRMDAFLEAGVNTFIDLTQSHELVPYEGILKEQAKIYGVNASYHRFPIRDHTIPSAETMTAILNAIDEAINNGGLCLCPLLGRGGTHGHGRWLLSCQTWQIKRTSPCAGQSVIQDQTRQSLSFTFARNR